MTNLNTYLQRFIRQLTRGTADFARELEELNARKLELENRLTVARLAMERKDSFVPSSGLETYCPRCWILNAERARVSRIPSDKRHIDLLRCDKCSYVYEIALEDPSAS